MNSSAPRLTRRRLMVLGTASAVVLGVVGGGIWLWRPGLRDGRLTKTGRDIFRAIARTVLEGCLPTEDATLSSALDHHLDRIDDTIAAFPTATQAEIAQLLGLLTTPPGRQWLTGLRVDWNSASVGDLEAALRRMRQADHELKQQAYHALRDLTNAAYFSQAEHWDVLGYPGPTAI